jgi:hypothetical protein
LASSRSTTFCVAMPAWSVPGTHRVGPARHAVIADQVVLDGGHDGMPQMQGAGDVVPVAHTTGLAGLGGIGHDLHDTWILRCGFGNGVGQIDQYITARVGCVGVSNQNRFFRCRCPARLIGDQAVRHEADVGKRPQQFIQCSGVTFVTSADQHAFLLAGSFFDHTAGCAQACIVPATREDIEIDLWHGENRFR